MMRSLLVLLFVGLTRGEICLVCNCIFVNITSVEESNLGGGPEITFGYIMDAIEPYNVNTTYEVQQKYFYMNCSSEMDVEQMEELEWPKLKVLGILGDFRNNKWKKMGSFPEDVKKQMTVLHLSSNLITEIEELELDDFGGLKMLNLRQNQITEIRKNSFGKLGLLTILDLSGNSIAKLDDWAFYGTQLRYLNLSINEIAYLTEDVFRGLGDLKTLDLSENRLNKLPDEFGNYLPALGYLSLRTNGFERLPELPKELLIFDVSHNRLMDLHLTHSKLEFLDVSSNELLSFEHINVPMLEALTASYNNVTQVSDLKTNRTRILNLSHNRFAKIPEVVTSKKLPLLEELYLDGNPITNVTFPKQSEPFSSLRVVSLSHLKSVKKIVKNSFHGVFAKAKYDCSGEKGISLNFSHNVIKFVDKDAFQTFSVCSIDLSHNHLKTLSESVLPWEQMSHVDLQENPWQCDCNIQWMLDDFLSFMYENQPRLLFGLRCSTPARYNNKMFAFWLNKSEHVFCNSGPSSFYLDLIGGKKVEIWTVSAIVCVVLGCFILVTAVIIVVLVCTTPKRGQKRASGTKNKGPPYYKQIQSIPDDKSHEYSEKCV